MEDLLKFLLVAGVIIVGFLRQARKEASNKPASPDMPAPDTRRPLPESWEGIPIPPPQKEAEKPPHISPETVYSSNSGKAEDVFIPKKFRNENPRPHPKKTNRHAAEVKPTVSGSESPTADIDIQSLEEVRRGILWSEILKRKY